MKIKSRLGVFLAVVGLATGAALAINVAPAFAMSQMCVSGGSGLCLNDWGNGKSGALVKMYYGGVANDNFGEQLVDRCAAASVVTRNCPFTDTNVDNALLGSPIVQVKFFGSGGGCLGLSHLDGDAHMGSCNSPGTGTGGTFGTVWVDDLSGHLISVGETNDLGGNSGSMVGLMDGGQVGLPAYLDFGGFTRWSGTFGV
jgi:hypothetical protein